MREPLTPIRNCGGYGKSLLGASALQDFWISGTDEPVCPNCSARMLYEDTTMPFHFRVVRLHGETNISIFVSRNALSFSRIYSHI